jgi:lysophospholipase L1-like esterase
LISTGGTGGIANTGGKTAAGGSLSTGGAPSTGGSKATGGVAATGGSKNTGGMPNTGGTTNGGAGSYKPCPTNGDPCKILPLGDSITWGVGYDGAYRVELFSRAVAGQKNITFTGSLSNGPNTVANTTFPKRNEGHSGWTIAQDTGLIPSPATDTANGGIPHIVLVHIGTNDIYAASGQATMPDRLGTLVDKIISTAPNALVVVAKITPLLNNATWNSTVNTYNNAIPGLIQTRAAAGKHVILADMNTGFTAPMLSSDGIHPTQSGYNFMGDQWYSVISSVLP